MEFIDKRTIKIDKELNELDKFVFEFLKVVEKHAKYVIISGYVPILFGRSRATEDVDIFIEELPKNEFLALSSELAKIEIKFARKNFDRHTLKDRLKVLIGKNAVFVPTIEEQIVYKKIVLGSDKDKEDARHLEEAFKGKIDKDKLKQLEKDIRSGKHEF